MNLREAIEAGAQRVSGRARRVYITEGRAGEYAACALGAAYLGCHSSRPVETVRGSDIGDWVDGLTERFEDVKFATSYRGDLAPTAVTMWVNDDESHADLGWDELLTKLDAYVSEDGTRLTDMEVC